MSIASEITRLQGVKSNILTAIGNKGVIVPPGSALNDCPGLIETIGGFAGSNKNYVDYNSKYPWCYTPNLNIDNARIIEENIVCKASSFLGGLSYHQCGGQWYTGTSSYFNGVAVYVHQNQVEFDYATATYEYETTASYDLTMWIRKNIIYDKNSGTTTCKIYYDDVLVCTHLIDTSNILFANNIPYCVGGTRFDNNTFKGQIDFNKSYIRIDGKMVWGCDALKSEAIIGGKRYKTVVMPDGKEWLAENLDFKFCDVGRSGTPTTPNAWYYNNNETTYGWNGYKCGLLYNWYAVKLLEDHKTELCPGWHVATKNETDALAIACGGSAGTSNIGNKLKALDNSVTSSWPSGWNGTNDYGFSALPSGFRDASNSLFTGIDTRTDLWTSDEYGSSQAYSYTIADNGAMRTGGSDDERYGFAVRLVRDT